MANSCIGKNKLKVANEKFEEVLLKERELKYITRKDK